MSRTTRALASAATVGLVAALTACGGGNGAAQTKAAAPTTVTVTPPAATVTVTATAVNATPSNGSSTSPAPASAATTAPTKTSPAAPTESKPDAEAIGASFIEAIGSGDAAKVKAAQGIAKPGTAARVYMDSLVALFVPGSNVTPGGTVNLGDVSVDKDGLVTDLTREGVPISKTVRPGDGKTYTATPGEHDDYTGKVTATIKTFRWFDGNLQMVVVMDNQSDKPAYFSIQNIVIDGTQLDAMSADLNEPGVKRPFLFAIPLQGFDLAGKQGGIVNFQIAEKDFEIPLPTFG